MADKIDIIIVSTEDYKTKKQVTLCKGLFIQFLFGLACIVWLVNDYQTS